jgi:hypothetical protein
MSDFEEMKKLAAEVRASYAKNDPKKWEVEKVVEKFLGLPQEEFNSGGKKGCVLVFYDFGYC